MLQRSTIQLLRIPFSLFLMPVFFFALSQIAVLHFPHTIMVFVILHLLIYPSSNGYNSYIDKDTESIGGVENPMQPTKELFYVSVIMDVVGVILSCIVGLYFAGCVLIYILASRSYSSKKIRLKKYPVLGFLTVFIFQGGFTFLMVLIGCGKLPLNKADLINLLPAIIACSFLIGGVYPLTQIYQHKQDKASGDITISLLLGYKGTFLFCAGMFIIAMALLFYYFNLNNDMASFYTIQLFLLPSLVYFFYWFSLVIKDTELANFRHTMNMNTLSSICLNCCFITLLIVRYFG